MSAESKNKVPIVLREANEKDLHFVHHSWLKSYWGSPGVMKMDWDDYHKGQTDRIFRLLSQSQTEIACDKEDPDHIYGWITGDGPIVHFLYVKKPFRTLGIGRALRERIEGEAVQYTHQTFIGMKVATRLGAVYNPYILEAK